MKQQPTRRAHAAKQRGVKAAAAMSVHVDVQTYNASQSPADRATCDALVANISAALPDAESKVWHGHPVWFLEGNPIVGYSTHKEGTRLLFWSGQSFDQPDLAPIGKFKAAEARFSCVDDIEERAMRRWLKKARSVQWDYKNIVKNKGVLNRLA